MKRFYTNVATRGNNIYVRGYNNGKKFQEIVPYEPYLFIESEKGTYSTISGKKVGKIDFESIKEAKNFINKYNNVSNFEVYGLTNFQYVYLNDEFAGEIEFDPTVISVVDIDIEVPAEHGFPKPSTADVPVSNITISKNKKMLVFGTKYYKPKDDNVTYVLCKDEADLLKQFLEYWNSPEWAPDVVTGWNIDRFDIPYLYNRICKVLSEAFAKTLSPWKIVYEHELVRGKSMSRSSKNMEDRVEKVYELLGISSLDYLELYRKFSFKNQESYKLDYIAQVELKENKLDYSHFKSIYQFYVMDYETFVDYNIHDVRLVDMLEDKLGLIQQVFALAYDAKVNYIDTLATVRPWDVIIHNYLMNQRIVVDPMRRGDMDWLIGGYVKEPSIGMSEWVVSFDYDSLYPHLIMQYNISPETYVGREATWPGLDRLISGEFDVSNLDPQLHYSHAANGCAYVKNKQGFLPALMEKMYTDRVKYKKLMIEAKKELEEIEKELERRENENNK